jgi:lipopolysaccharide transport system ATP-binding protein
LVIDEALSVGDAEFSRKSFERIMALRDAGKTILVCSHSMYQIDALCERALWLENGRLKMFDLASRVTAAYNASSTGEQLSQTINNSLSEFEAATPFSGRIKTVIGKCDDIGGSCLYATTLASTLSLTIEFLTDPNLPKPILAVCFDSEAGIQVSTTLSSQSINALQIDTDGNGTASIVFPRIPLMKGKYFITVVLLCDKGVRVYDCATRCLTLEVGQAGAAQGLVVLPHEWQADV